MYSNDTQRNINDDSNLTTYMFDVMHLQLHIDCSLHLPLFLDKIQFRGMFEKVQGLMVSYQVFWQGDSVETRQGIECFFAVFPKTLLLF